MGTKDTSVVPRDRRAAVTRKANLVIGGGVVRGTWATSGHDLVVTWLDQDAPLRQELEREASRLAGILDRSLRLMLRTG